MRKPTADEIERAVDSVLPDIIGPKLKILFCGINPGLYSAAVGHHFARPGNRFWPALALGGLTPRLFSPAEDRALLALGYGLTNVVGRATTGAAELTDEELIAGMELLVEKVLRFRPCILAILGITAYRTAFNRPRALLGRQEELIGDTEVWVIPNPSGLNAHCLLPELAEWLRRVKEAAEA